jgi:hypothetical protein
MIKDIENRFGVSLFDRTTLAFVVKDKLQLLPMTQLQYAIDNGFVNGNTAYFNNLVQTKDELETRWIIPLKDSWLAQRITCLTSPLSLNFNSSSNSFTKSLTASLLPSCHISLLSRIFASLIKKFNGDGRSDVR